MTAPHNPHEHPNHAAEIAAVREWNDARLAAMKPRVAEKPWLVRHGKLALAALAVLGAVIVWRVLA
jgi:glutathione S-transferase